jgi:hypothetical protein
MVDGGTSIILLSRLICLTIPRVSSYLPPTQPQLPIPQARAVKI